MYAIRIKKSQVKEQAFNQKKIWVEAYNGLYVNKSQRTLFATRGLAQEAMTESWEEIVEVPDDN